MLNSLYTLYDTLEEGHQLGIYKVETIGDAYMCATGVPEHRDPKESAVALCRFALKMIQVTPRTCARRESGGRRYPHKSRANVCWPTRPHGTPPTNGGLASARS